MSETNTLLFGPYCEHDWCYAPYVLLTYPTKMPAICRKCGAKTTLTFGAVADAGEYDRLIDQFAPQEARP